MDQPNHGLFHSQSRSLSFHKRDPQMEPEQLSATLALFRILVFSYTRVLLRPLQKIFLNTSIGLKAADGQHPAIPDFHSHTPTSTASSNNQPAMDTSVKPRRSHRKSRNGCRVCKSRHMKCDETRPACLNCSVGGRQCEYKLNLPSRPKSPKSNALPAPSPASCTSIPSSAATPLSTHSHGQLPVEAIDQGHTPVPEGASLFTLEHLALFHHAQNHMSSAMMAGPSTGSILSTVIEYALKAPYLMNEALAIAALHLGNCHPGRSDYYQHAAALQMRALSSFNEAKQEVSDVTCVPMFLFASLLGLHVLHDTLRNRPDNFSIFLDEFMGYLSLHRGVSAVTNQSWSAIKASKLAPKLTEIENAFKVENEDGLKELGVLYAMVDESHLNDSSVETYHAAIETLRGTFNLYQKFKVKGNQQHDGPLAFGIAVNEKYVDFLKQRRPEALVILAFYAVMLHWSRDFWVFRDGGQYLIRAITGYLGSHWERWLAWPNSVLDCGTPPHDPRMDIDYNEGG